MHCYDKDKHFKCWSECYPIFDDGSENYITIFIRDVPSFMFLSSLKSPCDGCVPMKSYLNGKTFGEKPLAENKHIVDKVHKQV